MSDIVEQAARVLSTQTTCDGKPHPSEVHQRQAQALADAGLLAQPDATILEKFVAPCANCTPEGRCPACKGEARDYYRAAINAINPNLMAKELARDSDNDAGGYVGRDLRELAERIKQHLHQHPEPAREKLTDVTYPFDRGQKVHVLTDKRLTEIKAQALEEAADAWHADNAGTSPRAYRWLQNRADQIRDGKQ